MSAKKTIVILITAFVLTNISAIMLQAQTTIWSEDFTYADGTIQGSGSPPKWTLETTEDVNGSDPDDHFWVVLNKMEARDLNTHTQFLYSEEIAINSYSDVSISIYCSESGDMNSTDFYRCEYRLNGGTWTTFATNGYISDDFTSATASQTGLHGTTVEFRIQVDNSATDEYHYFDDIIVQGTPNITFTNGANGALNFQQSSPTPSQDNWPLGQFSLAGETTGATLNSVTVTLGGSYESGDLDSNPFRIRASNTNDFGTATEIGSDIADLGSGNDITFNSLIDAIPNGTRYYWVTADISDAALDDDNINGTIDAFSDLSITNGSLNGSSSYGKLNAGGEAPLPVKLSSFTASYENSSVILQWTTESEAGGVGFIIERRTNLTADWQQIASYLTDNNLVCMNNPIGYTEYIFVDTNTEANTAYFYRLSDVDIFGNVTVLDVVEVLLTGVFEVSYKSLPGKTGLIAAYPNPFNPKTKIIYQLARKAKVDLFVYNVLGQRIRRLVAGVHQSAGSYNLLWDGLDDAGAALPSGTYVVVFKAGEYIKSEKVLLLR
ncbi:T9SS type A sorting domain-containing protein [candidate division KSB1 bacterium]|nr:T9SS type A sorting domain-containing protein [candidate division KSB1 bacterium]MBL7093428.1 T9SS type A sorting domain-containing protein [candidate division KSB1 bacterium]